MHDILDETWVELELKGELPGHDPDGVFMTTWHVHEPLGEVLRHAIHDASPSLYGEPGPRDTVSVLILEVSLLADSAVEEACHSALGELGG